MTNIEVCSVGGYDEVGRNCTALKVDDTVIILDLGLHMEEYIKIQDSEAICTHDSLMKRNAIPDMRHLGNWKDKVKAIAIGHGHLDHVGGAPFIISQFPGVPIFGTAYTMEILKVLCKEIKLDPAKRVNVLEQNRKIQIAPNIQLEFINVTHSIPQTVIVAIHTKAGTVLYALDFKFDLFPVLGAKTNPARLKSLKNVHALIVESLYAHEHRKMPSESVAQVLLRDIMLGADVEDKAMFVTTFASHIARLSEIIDYAKKLGREVIFLGRSMIKYITAAEKCGIYNFTKEAEMFQFTKQIQKVLKKVEQDRGKYVVVMTGHQGEKSSILSRLARDELKFNFEPGDLIIFSSPTIPTPTTIENRRVLETLLKHKNVRMYKDIHVSGHGASEDLRDLISMTNPRHIIPAHADLRLRIGLAELAKEMGYEMERQVHMVSNGQKIKLQ